MRVVEAAKSPVLILGFAGEKERTAVRFYYGDLAAEFHGGMLVLQVKRPGETTKYTVELTADDGPEDGYAIWTVSEYDCAIKGFGECQLIYSDGDTVAKKKVWKTSVDRSLEGADATIPDTWQDIQTELLTAAGAVTEAISAYNEITADATTLPEGSEATAEMDRTGETPVIHFGIPKGDPGYTPAKGVDYFDGEPGKKGDPGTPGAPGQPGQDGVSPTVNVTPITDGHEVTITDATGAHTFDVMDGEKGDKGDPTDVQVNGTSVVTDGVANVPLAGSYTPGVVRVNSNYGFEMDGTAIKFKNASDAQLKAGTNQYRTITPSTQHQSAFFGLAKAAGDTTQSASENPVGTYTDDAKSAIKTMLGVSDPEVTDVQVYGVSVVTDGVANVPLMSTTTPGVAKVTSGRGLEINTENALQIVGADTQTIKTGTDLRKPITPNNVGTAAFYGLAKAAGDTTQSASSNAVGTYTETAKSKISEMLNGSVSVTGTTPTINALPGIRYVCGEVSTLTIVLPASGIVDVVFESGATATVLIVTPPTGVTVKWANGFDPTSLDANTTYEINIMDGLGVVGSWS